MPITLPVPVTAKDWRVGPEEASITLVEYGDFQCPDSQDAYFVLKELKQENPGRIRHVFRQFPLTDVHPHALDAAKASEAAGALGKFWEMHAALYERRTHLHKDELTMLAEETGLARADFEQAFNDPQAYASVREDVDGLRPTGIGRTPTLFLHGLHYEGPVTLAALMHALNPPAG